MEKKLAFGIGIGHLLEIYRKTSLVSFFATTVVQSVHNLLKELDSFSKEWKWSEDMFNYGMPHKNNSMLKLGLTSQ